MSGRGGRSRSPVPAVLLAAVTLALAVVLVQARDQPASAGDLLGSEPAVRPEGSELQIWLRPEIIDREWDTLRAWLSDDDRVVSFQRLRGPEVGAAIADRHVGRFEMADDLSTDRVPSLVRVWTTGAETLRSAVRERPSVLSVRSVPDPFDLGLGSPVPAERDEEVGLIVWMVVDATFLQIEAVSDRLDELPEVERYLYVDEAATWDDFSAYFADEPEILQSVTPGQLPTSFEVSTTDPARVATGLNGLGGIDEVDVLEPETIDAALVARLAAEPEGLIVFLRVGASEAEVAEVAVWLELQSAVDGYRYIGEEETWDNFAEYFADDHELVELVRPDQLPTSFDVITDDPLAVLAQIEGADGLGDLSGFDEAQLALPRP